MNQETSCFQEPGNVHHFPVQRGVRANKFRIAAPDPFGDKDTATAVVQYVRIGDSGTTVTVIDDGFAVNIRGLSEFREPRKTFPVFANPEVRREEEYALTLFPAYH